MQRKTIIKIIVTILSFVSLIALILIVRITRDQENYLYINLYYYDPVENTLKPEERKITRGEEKSQQVSKLLAEFWQGSKKSTSNTTLPSQAQVISTKITGESRLEIDFKDSYYEIPSYEELLFRTAFVWSVTDLDFIKEVKILIEGEEFTNGDAAIEFFSRDNMILNHNVLPGKNTILQELVIYYPDLNEKLLVPTKINMEISIKNPSKDVLEKLVNGEMPEVENISRPFIENLVINKTEKQGSICYVDIGSEFLSLVSQDPEIEKLQIYSIVNSLTLPNLKILSAKEVQFFCNNKKIKKEDYKGSLDISQPFKFNKDIIKEID